MSDTNSGAIQGLCHESGRDLSNFSIVPPCFDAVSSGGLRSTQEFFFLNVELTYCMGGMDVVYTVSGWWSGEGGGEGGGEGPQCTR